MANLHDKAQKVVVCSTCNAEFTQRNNLRAHLKDIHHFTDTDLSKDECMSGKVKWVKPKPATGPFKCNDCGESFPRKENLSIHARTHEENPLKNFECIECSKRFGLKSNLAKHLRRKHPKLVESPPDVVKQHNSLRKSKKKKVFVKTIEKTPASGEHSMQAQVSFHATSQSDMNLPSSAEKPQQIAFRYDSRDSKNNCNLESAPPETDVVEQNFVPTEFDKGTITSVVSCVSNFY